MIRYQAHPILINLIFIIVCINCGACNWINQSQTEDLTTTIEVLKYAPNELPYGGNATIICKSLFPMFFWTVNDRNISEDESYVLQESENINEASNKKFEVSILNIVNVDLHHRGEYTCHAHAGIENQLDFCKVNLNVTFPLKIKEISSQKRVKLHKVVNLHCLIEGYPISEVIWLRNDENITNLNHKVHSINETLKNTTLQINKISKSHNGTYTCLARTSHYSVNKSVSVLVLDKPQVNLDFIKAIGRSKIFVNWTVNDGNEPDSLKYSFQYKPQHGTDWLYYKNHISSSSRSCVLQDVFGPDTNYTVRIKAVNSEGESQYSISDLIQTLSEDPVFIPEVKVSGVTANSITIAWTVPPDDLKEYIHYYQLLSHTQNLTDSLETIHLASKENLYMFSDLNAATTYDFQVAACNEYSHQCGLFSSKVNGTTMDGMSGPPENVSIECKFDNISHTSFVFVTWKPPSQPHGTIMSYNVILAGNASFLNDQGIVENTTWGPKVKSVNEKIQNARFYNVSANTNYTIQISGVTRTKRNGKQVELYCRMPPTIPDKQKLSRFNWRKISEEGKCMFKLFMHRISERNGPICCYRIYMVRMEPQQNIAELPSPENLPIVTYQEAHRTPKGGAYVAEMFTSTSFHPEVFLGDDQVYNISSSLCNECVGLGGYLTKYQDSNYEGNRLRRNSDFMEPISPHDGNLDIGSNYTGFIEIVIHGPSREQMMTAYSNYLVMMNPGPEVVEATSTDDGTNLIVQLLSGLCAVAFLLLVGLFILHR